MSSLTDLTARIPHLLRIIVGGLEALAWGVDPAELVTIVTHKMHPWRSRMRKVNLLSGGGQCENFSKLLRLQWDGLIPRGVDLVPESLMSLRASLSEKEDMSVAGLLAACSKLLKETLRVYTTSSDSSGLSLDAEGWNDTNSQSVPNNCFQWFMALKPSHHPPAEPSCPLSWSCICLQPGWPPHLRSWSLKIQKSTRPLAPSSPWPGFYLWDPEHRECEKSPMMCFWHANNVPAAGCSSDKPN